MTRVTITFFTPLASQVQTITADNGKEFSYIENIANVEGGEVYFVHPYHSWERGSNENTNGLLRQYFQKETNFKMITQEEVDDAVAQFNNRPRKTLGFKTPAELMEAGLSKLAA